MGASAGQLLPSNWRAAAAAWFSSTPIDPGLPPVIAINAFKIAEIAEGCSTGSNADGQNIDQGIPQLLKLVELQLPRRREGSDS